MAGADARFNRVFNRRYLLAEIADTQTNTNLVKISYDFSSIAEGLAERPNTLTYGDTAFGDGDYGGYKIKFGYASTDAGQTTVPVVASGPGPAGCSAARPGSCARCRSLTIRPRPARCRFGPMR